MEWGVTLVQLVYAEVHVVAIVLPSIHDIYMRHVSFVRIGRKSGCRLHPYYTLPSYMYIVAWILLGENTEQLFQRVQLASLE